MDIATMHFWERPNIGGFDYYGYIDDPLRIVVMVSTGIGIRGCYLCC